MISSLNPKPVFSELAEYYDLIYQQKPYKKEFKIMNSAVEKLLKPFPTSPKMLDLGCGTGTHASLFAHQGYSVTGLDRSVEMLQIARNRYSTLSNLNFKEGDITNFKLNQKFHLITSLFHVMSYLTENASLIAFLKNIKNHLLPEGVALFDCWYGPGVLTELPEVQYKIHQNKRLKLHRIKQPKMYLHHNVVSVTHTVFAEDLKSQTITHRLSEEHRLRYFFFPEVSQLLDTVGLQLIQWGNLESNFMQIKSSDWDAYFLVSLK